MLRTFGGRAGAAAVVLLQAMVASRLWRSRDMAPICVANFGYMEHTSRLGVKTPPKEKSIFDHVRRMN